MSNFVKHSLKPSIALVGCGDWGKNIARTLAGLEALGAIVDPTSTGLEKELRVPDLTFDQCLKDPSISAVVIATPTPTHFDLAHRALTAGKHILVEKPLATETRQVRTLLKLAKKNHRILMVGHLLIYHPAFQKIAEWVDSGKIGDVLQIQTYRMNLGKVHLHESVTWDLGPHDLSMVFALMKGSKLKKFSAHGKAHITPHHDTNVIFLEFEKGISAQVNLSRLHPWKEQRLVVIGTKGVAVFDDTKPWSEKATFYKSHAVLAEGKVTLTKDDRGEPFPLEPAEPLRLELQHFIQCIEKNQDPLTSAESALEAISLLNKIEKFHS